LFVFFMISLLPSPTLFPYTTLFRSPCKSLISCIVPFGTWIARFLNKLEGRGDDRRHAVVELSAAHACRQNLTSIDRHCCGHNQRSEEHTSELQSRFDLVCRLLLEKK